MTAADIAHRYKPNARISGGFFRIPCPAHRGDDDNLAIKDGDQGGLVLKCHSHDCTYNTILGAFQDDGLVINRHWTYPSGKSVHRQDSGGKKSFNSPGTTKGVPVLIRGDKPDALVVLTEGESDADAVLLAAEDAQEPIAVACYVGGADQAGNADYSALKGRRVAIWPDANEQGRKALHQAAKKLKAAGVSEILEIREVPVEGGGAADLSPPLIESFIKAAQPYVESLAEPNPPRIVWTSLKEILETPDTNWLVEGLIAEGSTNLIYGAPKMGKSMLVFGIMKAGSRGGEFLGHKVERMASWLLSEQSENSLSPQFRQLQIGEEEDIQVALWRNQPQWDTPEELADLILSEFNHADRKPGLIVIDTLSSFIDLRDSNDYSQVNQALAPIVELGQRLGKEHGTATIVTHHSRKSSGDGADSVLGSQAIAAKFDTLVKVTFTRGGSSRKIAIQSRFGIGDLGPELEVTLNLPEGEYQLLGSASEMEGDIIAAVMDGAHTTAEIRDSLASDADGGEPVSKQKVSRRLSKLVADNRLLRTGTGKATRYDLPPGGIESIAL